MPSPAASRKYAAPLILRICRLLAGLLAVLTLGYFGIVLLFYLLQSRLVYWPRRKMEGSPADAGLEYEDVQLRTSDGLRLAAWFLPAENARGAILFCHGNGGNLSYYVRSLPMLHGLGLAVLAFDYRGYGHSEGRPTEQGTYLDAEAAWEHLVKEKGFAPERIIILGRSLGGAVAGRLAANHPPAALILESTFTCAKDMSQRFFFWFPTKPLCRFEYNTEALVARIHCPLLVVHSPQDRLVPFSHGRHLLEAANDPKEFLRISGSHNNGFLKSGRAYSEGLRSFLKKHTTLVDG